MSATFPTRGPTAARLRALLRVAAPLGALALSACQSLIQPAPEPAAPPAASVAQLYAQPAERALINGLRAYDEGAFERAEQSFRSALLQSLRDRRDIATAHKYLAFIACAFDRIVECDQQFNLAFTADPQFLLTDAEIGHPVWGPVYRRVEQKRKAQTPPR